MCIGDMRWKKGSEKEEGRTGVETVEEEKDGQQYRSFSYPSIVKKKRNESHFEHDKLIITCVWSCFSSFNSSFNLSKSDFSFSRIFT